MTNGVKTNNGNFNSDFVVNAMQGTTDEREASQRLLGTDSQIGFPEKGSRLMTGEGGPNATFNTVFQIEDDGSAAGVFQADGLLALLPG